MSETSFGEGKTSYPVKYAEIAEGSANLVAGRPGRSSQDRSRRAYRTVQQVVAAGRLCQRGRIHMSRTTPHDQFSSKARTSRQFACPVHHYSLLLFVLPCQSTTSCLLVQVYSFALPR